MYHVGEVATIRSILRHVSKKLAHVGQLEITGSTQIFPDIVPYLSLVLVD